MKKKIFLFALLVYIFVAAFALVACTPTDPSVTHTHSFAESWQYNSTEHWHPATCEHTTERSSVAAHDFDKDGKCTVCNYHTTNSVSKITFDELVTTYKTKLCNFVANEVAPQVMGDKEVLNESYFVSADKDDNLGRVNLLYTYKDGETNRITELASVKFTDVIENKDISDGKVTNPSITISTKTVFEFDAKDSYLKQDLASLLYKAAGYGNEEVKVFKEVEDTKYEDSRAFSILVNEGGNLQVKTVHVAAKDEKDDTVKANLTQSSLYTVEDGMSVAIKGQNIFSEKYELEFFEPDKEDVQITDKQVQEAIEQNCKEGLVNRLPTKSVIEEMFGTFDMNKISDEDWRVNQENDQITGLNYAFTYTVNATSGYYIIASMNFSEPVSREDFVAGNLPKATYKQEYSLSYNPSIQDERSDLANAILTACKGAPVAENSKVILIDRGSTVDDTFGGDGHVGRFIVAEINENGATEYQVKIKHSTSDEQYIQEIANGNYAQTKPAAEHSVTGDKLTVEEETNKAAEEIANINGAFRDEI